MDANSSVTLLPGIGAGGKRALALEMQGIRTIRDLANAKDVHDVPAKARLRAISIMASSAPASSLRDSIAAPAGPIAAAGPMTLASNWTGLQAHVWAEPGVLVQCTIVDVVMTPAGICALVKFIRRGKIHHRAVTYQLLTSVAVQHALHVCETDDDERAAAAAIGLIGRPGDILNTQLIINGCDDGSSAFIIKEVEDIAQIR